MKSIRKNIIGLVMVIVISFFICSTQAKAVMLDFESLGDLQSISDFYNGGPGGNYGVTFSSNAYALIDSDAGGHGNFGGEPSPSTILFFSGSGATAMNIATGFNMDFSISYSNPYGVAGSIDIYDGLDGTGNLLAHLDLGPTPYTGAPDPTGNFSPFVPTGVAFDGTAMSIVFAGVNWGTIGFDNMTLDSPPVATPEPATILLMGAGLVGLVGLRRKFKK